MIGKNKKIIKDGKLVGIVHSDYAVDPNSLFNMEAIKMFEDFNFTEAVKKSYYVASRKNKSGYDIVEGQDLGNGLFCYKSTTWKRETIYYIIDEATGLAIASLPTLKDCKEWVKDIPAEERAKYEEAKQTERYQRLVKRLEQFKAQENPDIENPFTTDFPDPFDEMKGSRAK